MKLLNKNKCVAMLMTSVCVLLVSCVVPRGLSTEELKHIKYQI